MVNEDVDYNAETDQIIKRKADYLAVNYMELIPVTIKIVQEQQQLIETQAAEIEALNERMAQIERLLQQNTSVQIIELKRKANKVFLQQNQPNPFSTTTTIEYSIPETAKEGKIVITDLDGSVLKTVIVKDKGQLEIAAHSLPAGTYTYSLVVDGKIVATNKMVLTR